jgi:hypothetical protein
MNSYRGDLRRFWLGPGRESYVGVRDDGTVVGVTLGKGSLEDLANKIAQKRFGATHGQETHC